MEPAELADRGAGILRELELQAELYLEHNLVTSVGVSSGQVESVEFKEELGAGIRVFEGGRVGFAYTSDLRASGVRDAAHLARALAAHTDPDAANKLPRPRAIPPAACESGEIAVAKVETYRKIALARAMEEAARAVDASVTKVGEAKYSDVVGRVEVRNTEGLACGGAFARVYGAIDVIAEKDGDSQSGFASDFALKFSSLDPFKIGREAARRAVAKIGGAKAATARAEVVLDPEVTGSLLESLAEAISADAVIKGKSFLAGRVDQAVASPAVSLVDDGRFPGGNRSFHFDGEGSPTGRTVLIEGGRLRGYLHNAYTAARLGAEPTGNGMRSSYMGPPRVAPTTLYLTPSARSREEIMKEAGRGFLITEIMGLHTVDPITGEFSLGAAGHRLVDGEVGEPVAGMGLAGSLPLLLKGIAAVASDLRLLPGGTAGSTILVHDLSVSGT